MPSFYKISFCNSVLTTNGGTHEQGFRSGVAKSIRKIAKFKNNKLVATASADEILSNASYIVSVFINNPLIQNIYFILIKWYNL